MSSPSRPHSSKGDDPLEPPQGRPRILVRPPSPRLAGGELTHLARVEIDPELAFDQWRAYVAVFAEHGWSVTELEPLDAYPDGVFVEDTVVIFDDLAVLTSPGAPSRVAEVASTARALTVSISISRSPGSSHRDTSTAATCSRSTAPRTSVSAPGPI